MKKLGGTILCGVALNDADYKVTEVVWVEGKRKILWNCPFYLKWKSMIQRCYSPSQLKLGPTYKECYVCDEWLTFSKFKSWMETQDWEGKELDKDLLTKNNKVYSPDTCIFIETQVNMFISEKSSRRGEWPLGVHLDKSSGKFKAQCSNFMDKSARNLGSYDTPEEAHAAWLLCKLELSKILAKGQSDERVATALVQRYENYI